LDLEKICEKPVVFEDYKIEKPIFENHAISN